MKNQIKAEKTNNAFVVKFTNNAGTITINVKHWNTWDQVDQLIAALKISEQQALEALATAKKI